MGSGCVSLPPLFGENSVEGDLVNLGANMAHLGGELEDSAGRGMMVCSRVFDDEDEDDKVWLDDAVWWLPTGEFGRSTDT